MTNKIVFDKLKKKMNFGKKEKTLEMVKNDWSFTNTRQKNQKVFERS